MITLKNSLSLRKYLKANGYSEFNWSDSNNNEFTRYTKKLFFDYYFDYYTDFTSTKRFEIFCKIVVEFCSNKKICRVYAPYCKDEIISVNYYTGHITKNTEKKDLADIPFIEGHDKGLLRFLENKEI
jgi:hypothetical protein